MLLAIAGNETTRNAISHGVLALTRYPEQRDKWWADFDGVAHPPSRKSCGGRRRWSTCAAR